MVKRSHSRRFAMRKILVTASAVSLGALLATGLAWACTSQPTVIGLVPSALHRAPANAEGPLGKILVQGQFPASTAPLDIRWNGLDGPILAQALPEANGSFTASVDIPDAPADVYYIVVADRSGATARVAFQILPPGESPKQASQPGLVGARASADLWKGFATTQSTVSDPGVASRTPGPSKALGFSLFGLGLAGVIAGVGFAARRTKKALI